MTQPKAILEQRISKSRDAQFERHLFKSLNGLVAVDVSAKEEVFHKDLLEAAYKDGYDHGARFGVREGFEMAMEFVASGCITNVWRNKLTKEGQRLGILPKYDNGDME